MYSRCEFGQRGKGTPSRCRIMIFALKGPRRKSPFPLKCLKVQTAAEERRVDFKKSDEGLDSQQSSHLLPCQQHNAMPIWDSRCCSWPFFLFITIEKNPKESANSKIQSTGGRAQVATDGHSYIFQMSFVLRYCGEFSTFSIPFKCWLTRHNKVVWGQSQFSCQRDEWTRDAVGLLKVSRI